MVKVVYTCNYCGKRYYKFGEMFKKHFKEKHKGCMILFNKTYELENGRK